MSSTLEIEPEVGMGATMYSGSDRTPYTVIAVSSRRFKVTLQADKSVRVDDNGLSESQTWDCTPDPDGEIRNAYRDSAGNFHCGSRRVRFGARSMYRDPSR